MIRLDMAETFQVSVGEQGKDFVMHKHIATCRSPFSKAALTHDWKKAHEKRILLPDCELETFEGYLQWVYTSEIIFCSAPRKQPLELIKLWTLGDFLGDKTFYNYVSIALAVHEKFTCPDAIEHLYNHTSHDSLLRWSVLDIWGTRYSAAYVGDVFATKRAYPKDFIIDLFKFLAQYGRVVNRFGWVPVVISDDED